MSQRSKLNELAEENYGVEEKKAKITFDGKQFLVRIPKEISEILEIKKGDFIKFKLELAEEPKPLKESKLYLKYIRS